MLGTPFQELLDYVIRRGSMAVGCNVGNRLHFEDSVAALTMGGMIRFRCRGGPMCTPSRLPPSPTRRGDPAGRPYDELNGYSTINQSLALRPKTSGEYISSALAGGTTKRPGVVARAV